MDLTPGFSFNGIRFQLVSAAIDFRLAEVDASALVKTDL